ncbi:helix-turn-helix domain-containing protein [Bradyrhizobium sp. UFLA05-153]
MPSHIFTRVGYWKESIASNVESSRVANADKEGHESDHFLLKQELLSEMLGVRRTYVTDVANRLQKRGAIAYSRGAGAQPAFSSPITA